MSCWYAIPSARPRDEANACLHKWWQRGYKTAVFRDAGLPLEEADYNRIGPYQGYAKAVNELCRRVFILDPACNIIVTGGDDIDPDPTHDPAQIEREFLEHFGGSFGVMQPTGDRYMVDESGRGAAERVCLSPWLGRKFCERMYGGRGPLWEGWFHFWEDEELHEVASKLGVLWHRPDLSQYHRHWSRVGEPRPEHLNEAKLDWHGSRAVFQERKAAGFPGHEPLPLATFADSSVAVKPGIKGPMAAQSE